MASIHGGFRVVRGPDWSPSNEEDGGEGGVGTVVENPGRKVEDGNSAAAAAAGLDPGPGRVVVQWDTGPRNSYRCGAEGKHELRLLDTALAGVCHEGASCSECGQNPITGIRWRCRDCADTNLCSHCYGNSEHEIDHRFCAIASPLWKSLIVSRRNGSSRVMAVGLFVGATVCRGPDWDYDQPDRDGEVEVGIVKEISQPDPTSRRCSAAVEWPDSLKMTCRMVTHDGKVDLKCVNSGKGGFYYREHLPILGSTADLLDEERCNVTSPQLDVSCLVQVPLMDREILEVFSEQMPKAPSAAILSEMMFELGEVKSVDVGRDTAEVFFMKRGKCFTVHCAALARVHLLEKGDEVMLVPDKMALTLMMKQLGGREGGLDEHIGKTGRVCERLDDFQVLVEFGEKRIRLHPGCLFRASEVPPVVSSATSLSGKESSSASGSSSRQGQRGHLAGSGGDFGLNLGGAKSGSSFGGGHGEHQIITAVSSGNLRLLEKLCQQHRDHLNDKVVGDAMSLAHVAVTADQVESLEVLVKYGSGLESLDTQGGTPIHSACTSFGTRMLAALLRLGAACDVPGGFGEFPLHLACEAGNLEAVQLLICHGAVIDCLNAKGDTPLHDAIRCNHHLVVEAMLDAGANVTLLSEHNFNAVQHGAFHGSCNAMQVLMARAPDLVNEGGVINFLPLNIAANNNYIVMLRAILKTPGCQINRRDEGGATPLISAVSCGGRACVEELIALGAKVELADDMGNTALHIAISKQFEAERGNLPQGVLIDERDPSGYSPHINAILAEMPFVLEPSRKLGAIACFLAQHGCDIDYYNHRGQSPLSGCVDERMVLLLRKYSAPPGRFKFHGSRAVGNQSSEQRLVLSSANDDASTNMATNPLSDMSMMSSSAPLMNADQVLTNVEPMEAPPRNSDVSAAEDEDIARVCCVRNCVAQATVLFLPCGHVISCEGCCSLFNLCGTCKAVVERKLLDGKDIGLDMSEPTAATIPLNTASTGHHSTKHPRAQQRGSVATGDSGIADRRLQATVQPCSVASVGRNTPDQETQAAAMPRNASPRAQVSEPPPSCSASGYGNVPDQASASPRSADGSGEVPEASAGSVSNKSQQSAASPRSTAASSEVPDTSAGSVSKKSPQSGASPRSTAVSSEVPETSAGSVSNKSPQSVASPRSTAASSKVPETSAGSVSSKSPQSAASPRSTAVSSEVPEARSPSASVADAGRSVSDRRPPLVATATPHSTSTAPRPKPIRLACNFSNPRSQPAPPSS